MWTIALGIALGLLLVPLVLFFGKMILLAVLWLAGSVMTTPGRSGRGPAASPSRDPYSDPYDDAGGRNPHQSPYGDHWRP